MWRPTLLKRSTITTSTRRSHHGGEPFGISSSRRLLSLGIRTTTGTNSVPGPYPSHSFNGDVIPRRKTTTVRMHSILSSPLLPTTTATTPTNTTTMMSYRSFSRRKGGTTSEDPVADQAHQLEAERLRTNMPSANEMEFFTLDEDTFFRDDDDDDGVDKEEKVMDAEYQRQQEEIRKELDSRTGRGWTDPWHISEDQWMSLQTADDLPEWSPEFVSRISQERIQIHPDGIPSISTLATLSLPPEACPHPGLGQTKEYAAYRKQYYYNYIQSKVFDLIPSRVEKISKLKTWEEKQNEVDELFESVEEQLRKEEEILGLHPHFGGWVSKAIEEYLSQVQKGELKPSTTSTNKRTTVDTTTTTTTTPDMVPIFMDCFDEKEPDEMVPSILSPLKPHPRDGPGRMVEEWQLAAHKKTKRILLRPATQTIAKTLEKKEASRIFVHGRRGVGKVR